jgi:hypothetical protein
MCFLAFWISYFEKVLFSSIAHFFIGSLILGEFSFLSSFYFLVISPLSNVYLANIFSHSVGGTFNLETISFIVQKLFNFMKFHLPILSISCCWWECKLVWPFWKTIWRHFKKLNIDLIWSSNPTAGAIPKVMQLRLLQRHVYTHVCCRSIHKTSYENSQHAPLLMNGLRKIHNGIVLNHEEE